DDVVRAGVEHRARRPKVQIGRGRRAIDVRRIDGDVAVDADVVGVGLRARDVRGGVAPEVVELDRGVVAGVDVDAAALPRAGRLVVRDQVVLEICDVSRDRGGAEVDPAAVERRVVVLDRVAVELDEGRGEADGTAVDAPVDGEDVAVDR